MFSVDLLCKLVQYLHFVFMCLLAISDYKNAENLQHEGNQNRRVQEGLSKAQKLLKQSQKRNYYKILGVKRYYHAFLCLHLITPAFVLYLLNTVKPVFFTCPYIVNFVTLAMSQKNKG